MAAVFPSRQRRFSTCPSADLGTRPSLAPPPNRQFTHAWFKHIPSGAGSVRFSLVDKIE